MSELAALEAKRDLKRRQVEALFEQQQALQRQMAALQEELQAMDNEIDAYEVEQLSKEVSYEQEEVQPFTMTHADEILTEPASLTMDYPDEFLKEPDTQQQEEEVAALPQKRPASRMGQLEIIKTSTKRQHAAPPAGLQRTSAPRRTGTLDDFFGNGASSQPEESKPAAVQPIDNPYRQAPKAPSIFSDVPPSVRPRSSNNDTAYALYPWSQQVNDLLHNTFRIQSFRGHQEEIINATLSGDDVFVIMRTGGGKSLTYQLPALLEGRGPQRKITFVVSPLLSLIHDQEEQLNAFCRGSTVSFSSNIGEEEHARRWGLVRNPSAGVCLVLVTPEKIHKSNKLKNEMEKLYEQNRLGRFVIDECHCCSNWGHDFRPDYTKLGLLKTHFPSIPVLAVTATASDRIRDDVCQILRLGRNYRFFRSTARRPNLTYSVRPKTTKIVDEISDFIKTHHARNAGIVYTFSRKEADNVASSLCDLGIVARSYHSSVSDSAKVRIHKSWMRNETQVVVATIAFGLGINKPDVRFVLHHSLSKSLEAYYQESGRAGRDGGVADCVLYYTPKDVARMMCMIHGDSGEQTFWSMARYAQASGNDAVCKAIMLKTLGEPDCPDVDAVMTANDGITTEQRDVGAHAKTVTALLRYKVLQRENVTLPMLVKDWRSKNPPDWYVDLPCGISDYYRPLLTIVAASAAILPETS
jgi:ATP-dependent DNA helicase Q1